MTFIGVADCHGIESFIKQDEVDSQEIALLQLRAVSNDQRHAVAFEVTIEDEVNIQHIYTHIEKGNYEGALRALKKFADDIDVSNKKSWKLIPNPKLDPWR